MLRLTTRGYETLELQVGFDGTVVGEGAVGSDSQFFASSVVVPERARAVIAATLAFAEQAWRRIDKHGHVGDVVVGSAVPEAEHKVYAIQAVGIDPLVLPSTGLPPLNSVRSTLRREMTGDRHGARCPLSSGCRVGSGVDAQRPARS